MEDLSNTAAPNSDSWLDRPFLSRITLNWELILFVAIIAIAIFTRFYDLESRVMSHDESLHTYYSWRLYRGFGFEHSPLMHGPWQFITIALSYFLFGDSDWAARIPAVLTSILTVGFMWQYRRYLGRAGALIAALLFTISPFMLYYGRYVRNEAYVGLFGVVMLWAILRYLDSGKERYLIYLTAAVAMHFTAKETSFIYTAQAMLFLGLLFVQKVSNMRWPNPDQKKAFLTVLILGFVLIGLAGSAYVLTSQVEGPSAESVAEPADPTASESPLAGITGSRLPLTLAGAALFAFLVSVYFLFQGLGWQRIKTDRSFDMIILLGTIVLPHLSPFIVRAMGADPLDYSQNGMLRTAIVLVPMVLISIGIGLLWNPKRWLPNAAVFYAIFAIFFTTIFTNGQGFFTGLIGSLGYWLEQQGVRRGSQPWYYYLLVQIPVYEYLTFLGSGLAAAIGIKRIWPALTRRKAAAEISELDADDLQVEYFTEDDAEAEVYEEPEDHNEPDLGQRMALPFFGFWTITSFLAYTIAGEKMPWLTFHIALPMILLAGWSIGQLIKNFQWNLFSVGEDGFQLSNGWSVAGLLIVFIPSLIGMLGSLLGNNRPFQGSELTQLNATSTFITALVAVLLSGWGLARALKPWPSGQVSRLGVIIAFGFLTLLTARVSFIATFVNYDNATEYLVYAHAASPVKEVMEQAEEISRRTSGDLSMVIAYDDDVSWPFTWYLRNYDNSRYYAANPTRDLRDVPIIIVGDNNFSKIEPVVGQAYYQFDYIRMWWPDQDYFDLTWDRLAAGLRDPEMRAALFNIWFNRDYDLYAQIKGRSNLELATWSPADRMRMYVRKDVAASIWNYGVAAAPEAIIADPYEGKDIELSADFFFGEAGSEQGQFAHPRGLAFGPDGDIYVADSDNHRIQRFNSAGEFLNVWGSFADILQGDAPAGTFNQPWDLAVGPDGSVYVADTWNHRIQRFSAEGQFISMWGFFGQAEAPDAFWGPRAVEVDAEGNVHVTDTGNKRIVVFTADGQFLNQFGEVGFSPGQFDEPVGLALAEDGSLYIADTWNQRIQKYDFSGLAGAYTFSSMWDIFGWFGQSLDNKPYLALDSDRGRLYVADPEGYRILEFDLNGEPIRFWGDYSSGIDGIGLVSGIAVAPDGSVWVSDGANNRILRFNPP
jgi:uncharacterized protein (TIGR03663 family)